MDYAALVLQLLEEAKYPVLEGYVLMDIYYKMIPTNHPSTLLKRYDRLFDNPEDVYVRDMEPFSLTYLVPNDPRYFYMHRVDTLDTNVFPMQCITVKLNRFFIDDNILHARSSSFEEEIYLFLTLLNYDVPRIARVIDLDFMSSTRFLPQRIQLWVFKYSEQPIHPHPLTDSERLCFGPRNFEIVPIRFFSGRLSECTSQKVLLSLNNHYPFLDLNYFHYYADKWQSIIPLAFNPLENPIILH